MNQPILDKHILSDGLLQPPSSPLQVWLQLGGGSSEKKYSSAGLEWWKIKPKALVFLKPIVTFVFDLFCLFLFFLSSFTDGKSSKSPLKQKTPFGEYIFSNHRTVAK